MKTFRRMREGLAGTTKKCAREEMTSLLRAQSWDHVIVFFLFTCLESSTYVTVTYRQSEHTIEQLETRITLKIINH